ncbi:MAG: ABC transporter substrate-binding protein [Deltaproteobacteria bacterium]|nr:ABC transporter substrate-binding protein [Deltaproteobacteria bacterium]
MGFFVREAINLVVVPVPGGTDRIVAALDKGEIDAGKNATPYLIQAVLKGSDAVAIVAQTTNPVYSLIVRPEIKGFADLKGKVLVLSTPGDTIALSTVRLLAQKGVKISSPVPGNDTLILAFHTRSSRQPDQLQADCFLTSPWRNHVAVSP